MNSAGDSGTAIEQICTENVFAAANVNSKRPVTAGEIQDKLRDELNAYSENNPEPPFMKN